MKSILLDIINNDKSYNKSALKMLKRTHPDLWHEVLENTSFLSEQDKPKPKQRVWHILNDIWQIPVCPESGLQCKWNENKYLTFANHSYKASYQNKLGLYNNHNLETNKKRSETVKTNYRAGKHIKVEDRNITPNPEKAKQTNLLKYGFDNPAKSTEIRKKISQGQIDSGFATPRELRSLRRLYQDIVIYYTKQSWLNDFDKINPERLNRSKYDLDHIYSIHQGFRDNIPAHIIGHWTNLRLISKSMNSAKGGKCHKTQDQLFEDFFNN